MIRETQKFEPKVVRLRGDTSDLKVDFQVILCELQSILYNLTTVNTHIEEELGRY